MTQQINQDNIYIAFLKQDYDSPRAVRLNRFDEEVKELLAWGIPAYQIIAAAKEKDILCFDERILYPKFLIEDGAYMVRTEEYDQSLSLTDSSSPFPTEQDIHNDKYNAFMGLFIFEENAPAAKDQPLNAIKKKGAAVDETKSNG